MRRAEPSKAHQKPSLVRLRAHHMLCALTFNSRGYGPDFVSRFESLIDQIMQGNPIQLIAGPDDLCDSKQNCGGCDSAANVRRDQKALKTLEQMLPILANSGIDSLSDMDLLQLRALFAVGSARAACEGCRWFDFCSHEAQRNFRSARLQPKP